MATVNVSDAVLVDEPDHPRRVKAAATKPTTPHMEAPAHPVCPDFRSDRGKTPADLIHEFVWHPLVGIEDQNPGMFRRNVVERPVALGAEALEDVLNEAHAALATDSFGGVGAEGIDNDRIVAPRDALKTAGEVNLLVEREDHHRDGDASGVRLAWLRERGRLGHGRS
jgi:hypothetical protein